MKKTKYNEIEEFKSRIFSAGPTSDADINILKMIEKANEDEICTFVTPLEMEVLREVEAFDLNDGTQDCFYGQVFHSEFDMKVTRGVVSSLIKKGIVSSAEEISNPRITSTPCTEIVISNDYTGIDTEGYFEVINVKVK